MGLNSWGVDNSWTLFLDRDGVVNQRILGGYVRNFSEFKFLDGVLGALKCASDVFGRIVIVTNQQGVAKGIMTESELDEIHRMMLQNVQEAGGKIDAVYAAIELDSTNRNRRKPSPAMGLEAQLQFPEIDFKKSVMVGDTDSDLDFGMALGMKTVLVKSDEKVNRIPDIVVSSLNELFTL